MKKIITTLGVLILLVTLAACSSKNSSYTDPDGKEYKYKLELTGTMPNASKESKYIILTNDNTLTFDKVAKSITSSNSKDSDGIDYYLLNE
ncbi:lipoprotein [Paenibacillus sp. GCM10027627]|uniref:LptM family lipoprotein n=1 Tax=unclassified Paenibacillus TaxID=185978 RepID=UPI0036375405